MAWSRKKILARLGQYLENKKIPFHYDEENLRLQLELYFNHLAFMLYPYIAVEDNLCSIDINVSRNSLKGFDYVKMNAFNQKSKFFKAYITDEGIVVLEYRFILNEIDGEVFDAIIDSLYAVEGLIQAL